MDESKGNALVRVQQARSFEGHDVATVEINGQPRWMTRHIAGALGYRDAAAIAAQVRDEWSDELAEGTDYVVVAGGELAALKAAAPDLVDKRAPSLMLLTESGVHLVAMLTRQPAGKRLRRWLAEEVLPALRRDGAYAAPGALVVADPASGGARDFDVAKRLRRLLDALRRPEPAWVQRLEIRIAELETGEDLDDVRGALLAPGPSPAMARRDPAVPAPWLVGDDAPAAPHEARGAVFVAAGRPWPRDLIVEDIRWLQEQVELYRHADDLPERVRPGLRAIPGVRHLAQRWNLRTRSGSYAKNVAADYLRAFVGHDGMMERRHPELRRPTGDQGVRR